MGKCQKCGRTWKSITECHCSACCNHFTRASVFDKHRTGSKEERACLDIEGMIADKLVYDAEKDIWKGEPLPEGVFNPSPKLTS